MYFTEEAEFRLFRCIVSCGENNLGKQTKLYESSVEDIEQKQPVLGGYRAGRLLTNRAKQPSLTATLRLACDSITI
jgi:hypothetical protein